MVCHLPCVVGLCLAARDLCMPRLVVPEFRCLVGHKAPDDLAANTLGKVAGRRIPERGRVGLGDVPQLGQVLVGPMLQARIIDLELNVDGKRLGKSSTQPCAAA